MASKLIWNLYSGRFVRTYNQLCTEIIISKLVIFLNSLGKETTNTLDDAKLKHLLRDSIDTVQDTLLEFAQAKGVYTIRSSRPPSDYKEITEADPTNKTKLATNEQYSYVSFLLVAAIAAGVYSAVAWAINSISPDTLAKDSWRAALPVGLGVSSIWHAKKPLPPKSQKLALKAD